MKDEVEEELERTRTIISECIKLNNLKYLGALLASTQLFCDIIKSNGLPYEAYCAMSEDLKKLMKSFWEEK